MKTQRIEILASVEITDQHQPKEMRFAYNLFLTQCDDKHKSVLWECMWMPDRKRQIKA